MIIENNLLKKYLKDMFFLSSVRGKEASGLAINYENKINIIKKGLPYNLFIKSRDYEDYIAKNLNSISDTEKNISIIGHTRLSTNGSGNFDLYNHPIVTNNIVGIHNGLITDCEDQPRETTRVEVFCMAIHSEMSLRRLPVCFRFDLPGRQ